MIKGLNRVDSYMRCITLSDGNFQLASASFRTFCPPYRQQSDPHIGVAIGDYILDLNALTTAGVVEQLAPELGEKARHAFLQVGAFNSAGRTSESKGNNNHEVPVS